MAEFKYKFSNNEESTTDADGKRTTYKVCDVCGARCHTNYGFKVELAYRGTWCKGGSGYCTKCANKLVPILFDAVQEIREKQWKMYQESIAKGENAELRAERMQFWEDIFAELDGAEFGDDTGDT